MNTLVLFASPNKDSRTKMLLDEITKEASLECDIVDVYKSKIAPCIDCGHCSKHMGECSIKDDMQEIYRKIDGYDNIILAAPMYFGMFPAPLIALIDRTQMIWCRKYIFKNVPRENGRGIIISTAGNEWNDMYEPMKKVGKYFFNTVGCELKDTFVVTNTDREKSEDVKCDIVDLAHRKGEKLGDELF